MVASTVRIVLANLQIQRLPQNRWLMLPMLALRVLLRKTCQRPVAVAPHRENSVELCVVMSGAKEIVFVQLAYAESSA